MGEPKSCTTSPDAARTVDARPSQPTTRSACTSSGPFGVVALTPATRPDASIRPVTCDGHHHLQGWEAPALVGQEVQEIPLRHQRNEFAGRRNAREVRDLDRVCTDFDGRVPGSPSAAISESLRASPSSRMIIKVEGCTVSPRKSRRKSACFSSTTVRTPARPSKITQHHAGGSAAGDTALDLQGFGHAPANILARAVTPKPGSWTAIITSGIRGLAVLLRFDLT